MLHFAGAKAALNNDPACLDVARQPVQQSVLPLSLYNAMRSWHSNSLQTKHSEAGSAYEMHMETPMPQASAIALQR